MSGRGGMGGNDKSGTQQGNQQSARGGSQRSDSQQSARDADSEPMEQGGERVGMGHRSNSQQSDKWRNQQADRWSGSEQSDRQSGMQGQQGRDAGHDIDDLGSKQSGARGSRSGNPDDQSSR
ncbi:hypothetical protein LSQ66_03335 [Massilia endophytica]|nr:hypothetical protein LSQ66_03335 [Massilia endophytica]